MTTYLTNKKHYLVVGERRLIHAASTNYAEALNESLSVAGGWVLEVVAKKTLEALRLASSVHYCTPTRELVNQLKIKWVFADD